MSDDVSFGRWLKQQRAARDLTQEKFAELLNVSPSAIRKFEAGERRPSRPLAEEIAKRLALTGVELDQFNTLVRARDTAAPPPTATMSVAPPPIAVAVASPRISVVVRPRSTNLPTPPTSFVGRRNEVEQVRRLLLQPELRLLTLLGPPGIGKTRLSIEAANSLSANFAHGVWWVPLAPLHDATLVAATIVAQLGIKESGGSPRQLLQTYLAERQVLLVLDNFEQILPAATLVGELIAAAPGLKVLTSSRAPLRLYAEHVFPVPFLSLPDWHNPPPLEQLSDYEALSLFMDRARAVKPGFTLTARDAPLVIEICARLEGLPLAIELAAARMRLLAPRAILARLERRLDLLAGGAIDLPERQQTLRGAIAWSYDMLGADEQLVFRRLGVFVGGCSVEAADEVVGARDAAPIPARPIPARPGAHYLPANKTQRAAALDVPTCLEALTNQSLLRAEEGSDGEPRFNMLETIREYALEQLASSGEFDILSRRHALHYLALAEQAEPELTGADQQAWLARLDGEHDNIRAALEWTALAASAGDDAASDDAITPAAIGLRIAGALWRFWEVHGQIGEGRSRLAQALAFPEGAAPAVLAKALNGAGNLAFDEDDYTEAIELHQASLALNRELGDHSGIAKSLSNLGNVAHRQGNYALAQLYHQESLDLRRELRDGRGIAISLTNLGEAAAEQGDYNSARRYYEEALTLARVMGEQWGTALSLNNLGELALHQGDFANARQMLEESLELFRQFGDKRGQALALGNLGLLARRRFDFAAGGPIYEECLLLFRDLGSKHGIAVSLEGLAAIAGGEGRIERAAKLRGAAEAVRAGIGAPRPPDNRPEQERRALTTRARDDREVYANNWLAGRAMSLDQAVEYALDRAED